MQPERAPHDMAPQHETREQEARTAGYSSAEQAQAATELAQMYVAHKTIDKELAGRAREMLKSMVDGGGDIDVAAVHALLAEAERRYAVADNDIAHGIHDEVTEPRHRALPVANEGNEEVTMPLPPRVEPPKVRFVPPPLTTPAPRPADDMFAGPSPSERAARVVPQQEAPQPPSVERQTLSEQRAEATRLRDVIAVKLRTANAEQKAKLLAEQKAADARLVAIEDRMRKAA